MPIEGVPDEDAAIRPSGGAAETASPESHVRSARGPGRNAKHGRRGGRRIGRDELSLAIPQADVRGLALAILAVVAVLFALKMAAPVLVPLLFGVILTYTLNPLVVWLEHRSVRRALGATVVMCALVSGLGYLTVSLRGEAEKILEDVPRVTAKLSSLAQGRHGGQPGVLQRVQTAAREVEKARNEAGGPGPKSGPTHVVVDDPAVNLGDLMWEGSRGLVTVIGELVIVLFLAYFLLLSGDRFKRKLVSLAGPSLSAKKITVQILEDINVSIQKYMLALVVTNVILAAATWAAFAALGLENAGAWAVTAGLLHLIPYFGTLLTVVVTGLAAFMQQGSVALALEIGLACLGIAAVVGMLITTWMTGRITRMNAAAVFVSLLFWTFLWGPCGALLAVPVTGIIKVVCQRIDSGRPLAELLAE